MNKNIKFVQGNEAVAEAAMYSGLSFFAGYPITPATDILEEMEDEDAAALAEQIDAKTLERDQLPEMVPADEVLPDEPLEEPALATADDDELSVEYHATTDAATWKQTVEAAGEGKFNIQN